MLDLQVKILRDPERRDAEGQPSSRGLAFVEFADHEHALCALRELNNNPSTFSKPPALSAAPLLISLTSEARGRRMLGDAANLLRAGRVQPSSNLLLANRMQSSILTA